MTTRIMPNGMKVHFVHPDGTHYKEGEKFPQKMHEEFARKYAEFKRIQADKERHEKYMKEHGL